MAPSRVYGRDSVHIDVNIIRCKVVCSAHFVQQNRGISFTELLVHLLVLSIELGLG